MSETVEIIINAKDNASGTLGGISGGIKSLGNMAATVAKAGLAVFAAGVAAVGTGLAYSLKQAIEAQEGLAQLDAVLKSTGGTAGVTRDMALELADSLSAVTRFSDDSVLAAENLLLTFTNIGEDVFPRATETLLDMATAMGTDAESGAIQLGKALNDPVAGITALTRVGVTFTDEQKKAIEAMVEMGDVAGAQTIILDELAKEFGGSAEAAGQTFAGQLDILKNSLDNVAEGVGMALLPILQDLTGFVTESVLPWVVGIGGEFARLLGIFQETGWADFFVTFEDGSSYVGSFFEKLGFGEETANKIGTAVNNLAQWLGTNLPLAMEAVSVFWAETLYPALLDIQTGFTTLANWLQGDGKAAWDNFMLSLQPLIDGFVNLATTIQNDFPLMQAKADEFVAWATTEFGPPLVAMVETIKTAFSRLVVLSGDDLNTMATFWNTHKETIMTIVSVAFQFITVTIGGALTLISGLLASALLLVQGDWSLAWDTMKTTLETFMNLALGIVGTNLEEFNTVWSTNWGNLKLIWDTFWGNFITTWQTDWDLFQTIVGAVIDNVMLFFAELKKTINGMISLVQGLIDKILAIPGIPGAGNTGGGTGGDVNINDQTIGGTPGASPATDKPVTVADLLAQGDLLGAMELARNGQAPAKSRSPLDGPRTRGGRTRAPLGGTAPAKGGENFSMVGSEAGSGNIIYQLIIYSRAKTENLIDDFNMLKEAAALG